MQHRSSMGHLIKGYVPMLELNIAKPSDGSKLWQIENNKPDYGINLSVIDFGNPNQLGQSYSISPFIELPLSRFEKPQRVIFRMSWGLAYLTKKFDIENNHKNIAIGSHWNIFVQYRFLWHLKINNKYRFEPGITISHTSNGRAQVPNLGLNLVSLNLGLNINSKNQAKEVTKIDSSTVRPSKQEFLVWYGLGMNEKEPPGGNKFIAHTLSLNYFYNKRNTHKFGLGSDVFYEESYLQDLKDDNIISENFINKLRIGPKICYAYNIGALSIPVEFGYYAFSKSNADGDFFHRFGIRYYGKKGLMLHFSLKTHFAIAHHFDIGFGYRIPVKKKHV